MIASIFHPGSGLGNQLFRYVAARTVAEDNGWEFGMLGKEHFKGSFMDLDMGAEVPATLEIEEGGRGVPTTFMQFYQEKKELRNGIDVRGYDINILDVTDNTILDGEFQDEKYFAHRLPDIAKWLYTEPLFMPAEVCVLNFRGGEYKYVPELFLPKSYWEDAMACMRKMHPYIPHMRFIAVTDDVETARQMLPDEVKIYHDMATDWRTIRSARYLILSNSSFAILPALLNNNARKIIAPRYWARRNTGGPWATGQNCYGKFIYI